MDRGRAGQSYNEEGEILDYDNNYAHEEREDEEFSMSSYDGEQTDSLVIKPPQAVVQQRERREKRDKRDKKERHRHKSERHKNRERTSTHEERRREHRRHRVRDVEGRREGKHHESSKPRSSKHEGRAKGGALSIKERLGDREQERRRARAERSAEFYMADDLYDSGGGRSRSTLGARGGGYPALMSLHLSPREKAERDKRVERFLEAEKSQEVTRRAADARRIERREEHRHHRRRRNDASTDDEPKQDKIPRKKYLPEPEMVELISDEEEEEEEAEEEEEEEEEEIVEEEEEEETKEMEEEVEEQQEKKDEGIAEADKTEHSSSSDQSSDSDDDSSSSSSEDDDEGEEEEAAGDAKSADQRSDDDQRATTATVTAVKLSSSRSRSVSASSTDQSAEEEKPEDERVDSDRAARSPSPLKAAPLPPYLPAIMGCRSVDEFECLNRIEEGTYGVVYRAREKASAEVVALKRLKMEKEKEGFPITSLREVNTLLKAQHVNIVTVREIVVGSNMDKIYIVMDYVEHDLKSLMETMRKRSQAFTIAEVKTLMMQLTEAVRHLHDNWILHRDLKTSNLLLSHRGILKVGDFGLAREYGSPLKSYTPIVVTLWYRAPELLLGTREYSCPIDVWSLGCIFGELLAMEPMFPGKSEIDQLNKIFKELGTPSDKIWPGYSQLPVAKKTQFAFYPYNHLKERFKTRLSNEGFKLLNSFLTYDPAKRITCVNALSHAYFREEDPPPIAPEMFPTWPAKSERPHGAKKTTNSPKPPSGGKKFKDIVRGEGEDESIAGFFLGGAPTSGPGFTLKF